MIKWTKLLSRGLLGASSSISAGQRPFDQGNVHVRATWCRAEGSASCRPS